MQEEGWAATQPGGPMSHTAVQHTSSGNEYTPKHLCGNRGKEGYCCWAIVVFVHVVGVMQQTYCTHMHTQIPQNTPEYTKTHRSTPKHTKTHTPACPPAPCPQSSPQTFQLPSSLSPPIPMVHPLIARPVQAVAHACEKAWGAQRCSPVHGMHSMQLQQ